MDNGCLLVLYSCLLSRSIEGVRSDGDESTSLLDRHGYANQSAVNLLRASGDVERLRRRQANGRPSTKRRRGAERRRLFDLAGGLPALCGGAELQGTRSRVWVVYSESPRALLVGDPLTERGCTAADGLANQDEVIQLSIDEDYSRTEVPKRQQRFVADPPLELVVRSLYPHAKVDWNGAEPIL